MNPARRNIRSSDRWSERGNADIKAEDFDNGEEEEVKLAHVVPFLVEDDLLRLGATFAEEGKLATFFRY